MTSKISGGDYGAIFRSRERKIVLIAVAAALAILAFAATPAMAETPTPQWTVSAVSRPTTFAVGSTEDSYVVVVTNTGGAIAGCTKARWESEQKEYFRLRGEGKEARLPVCPEDSSPVVSSVTIEDDLPAGLEALPGVTAEDQLGVEGAKREGGKQGSTPGANFSDACGATSGGGVSCAYGGLVTPGDSLILRIPVKVTKEEAETVTSSGPQSVTNIVRTSGGGAPAPAVVKTTTTVYKTAEEAKAGTAFGVAEGGATTALSSVQAGAHANLTTTGAFDTLSARGSTAGAVKSIADDLPAGFAGDLVNTEACQSQQFLREDCPVTTQVGVTTQIFLHEEVSFRKLEPVYNLAPEPGEVAKIGFSIPPEHYVGDIAVRAPGEGGAACSGAAASSTACEPYGLQATFYNITGGFIDYDSFSLTIWGVPASPIHDPLRFDLGAEGQGGTEGFFGASSNATEVPYLTNPTQCGNEQLRAELHVTSWEEKEAPRPTLNPPPTPMEFGPVVGCDRLLMAPLLTAEVTSDAAYSATGFDLDTEIPQTYNDAQGLATSTLKQEVVTLPEGMTVNPSSGAGLGACSEAQYAEELAPAKTEQEKNEGKGCPNSSKLATVRIKTPSISEELVGSAYLAESAVRGSSVQAGRNPFNSLLALYLIARAPDRGVLVKAPGLVAPNEATGRLTTTFGPTAAFAGNPASPGLPPLPASDISFAFNSDALVTPPTCGNYEVEAQLTPWSDPEGNPLTPEIRPFPIDASCPAGNTPPFNPGVTAYPIHANAGAYSPLYLKITRNDGEQEITGFSTQFPAGLTGNLSGVAECSEAQIQQARGQTGVEAETSPACPAGSEIGYSIAEAGVGKELAQTPGKIYLGGPYSGSGACAAGSPGCAPFSVVAITAAHVGPFDLGTVVIHFPLDIDPSTAAVTIPAGQADQIPHIIKGIVIHVRTIRAYISRNDFMLNPTSCPEQTLSATVIGGGADPTNPADEDAVTVNDPFQTADCSSLRFEPKFAASTSGKTSRASGASLSVKLTYPTGSLGQDANIKQVKVDLPKQLPSRLTTLQKACTAAQFNANPAGCPSASIIGHARALTPILPVALEGPAYFVSHGGEAFPELEIVLQGDGVTIVLTGNTFISHAGITSSTFKTVPDQPVTSFELTLPEGKFSALAANGNLCAVTKTVTVKKKVTVKVHGKKKTETRKVKETEATTLQMPTEFIGQNGAAIHETTPVGVTGCAKSHSVKASKKKKSKKKRKK
jgi:hypothetical protein